MAFHARRLAMRFARSHRRKSRKKSDDDEDEEEEDDNDDDEDTRRHTLGSSFVRDFLRWSLVSDAEINNFLAADRKKSKDEDDSGNEDRRRSTRTTLSKNYAKHDEDSEDEDYHQSGGRPPPKRMRYKKRRGSDDSFVDDDDYEKLARKREIVKYGKSMPRSSITDHIKKLVEDDEEEQTTDKQSAGRARFAWQCCTCMDSCLFVPSSSFTPDANEQRTTDGVKQPSRNPSANYDEAQPSDDDDFPMNKNCSKPTVY